MEEVPLEIPNSVGGGECPPPTLPSSSEIKDTPEGAQQAPPQAYDDDPLKELGLFGDGETKKEMCLICSSLGITQLSNIAAPPPPGGGGDGEQEPAESVPPPDETECIRSHMVSVFLLRHVLNFPSLECAKLLQKTFGINPGEWYGLCDACAEVVQAAFLIHQQVVQLQANLKACKDHLEGKLRQSFVFDDSSNDDGLLNIRNEIRDYFKEHLPPETIPYPWMSYNIAEEMEEVVVDPEVEEFEDLSSENPTESEFSGSSDSDSDTGLKGKQVREPRSDPAYLQWMQKMKTYCNDVPSLSTTGTGEKVACKLCKRTSDISLFHFHLKRRHGIDIGKKPFDVAGFRNSRQSKKTVAEYPRAVAVVQTVKSNSSSVSDQPHQAIDMTGSVWKHKCPLCGAKFMKVREFKNHLTYHGSQGSNAGTGSRAGTSGSKWESSKQGGVSIPNPKTRNLRTRGSGPNLKPVVQLSCDLCGVTVKDAVELGNHRIEKHSILGGAARTQYHPSLVPVVMSHSLQRQQQQQLSLNQCKYCGKKALYMEQHLKLYCKKFTRANSVTGGAPMETDLPTID